MDPSNEVYRSDENSTLINHGEIYRNEIEDHLYDVKEDMEKTNNRKDERREFHEMFKYSLMSNSGDVSNSLNKNEENVPLSIKSQISIRQSINSLFKQEQFNDNDEVNPLNDQQHLKVVNYVNELEKMNDEQDLILPEKIDLKDLNPYEPSSPLLSMHDKSQEKEFSINTISSYSYSDNQSNYQTSLFDIECCTTSTCLVLPQSIPNQIKSSSSFQQFWSPRVYSPKLIDSHTLESPSSILRSLITLLSISILTGFYVLYSCIKILRYDAILFSFCYLLGSLFGMNAYLFIDFLLILVCFISILVATYEKWLFRYINVNEYQSDLNNTDRNNGYWRQIKLAAYGLGIGTISTFLI